jgi:nucleoside-diphosphate-sugar epimerase
VSRALVTGATGLVGSHIVEHLLAQGWQVRALVRSSGSVGHSPALRWDGVAWLRSKDVELSLGDVLDLPAFAEAARGCDVIFHTAATVLTSGRGVHAYDAYRAPNVDGTRNAISAAERTGARLLHVSSVAVYGPHARYKSPVDEHGKRLPVTESTPLRPLPDRAYYARSKRESEELVLRAHADRRIWATAVRPDVIYGPRDRYFVPRLARIIRLGVCPVVDHGRTTLAVVQVGNVAAGAICAATSEAAGGSAFNLANDFDVTLSDFFRLGAEGLGKNARILSIPSWFARALVTSAKSAVRILSAGSVSIFSSTALNFVTNDNPFSSERARRELGWSPAIRPEQGIPEAFRWWAEHR